MTRTVEQARRWPMPGDAWVKGHQHKSIWAIKLYSEEAHYVCFLESCDDMFFDNFRRWVADAAPVRIFEGEA